MESLEHERDVFKESERLMEEKVTQYKCCFMDTVMPVYSGGQAVAVIKRWPASTGPNTCYGETLGPINLAVL